MSPQQDTNKKTSRYLKATSLGINMAAGMAVFSFLGYWVDQKTGGGQIWTLVGIFLGLFYCGYEVWKLIREPDEDMTDDQSSPPQKR